MEKNNIKNSTLDIGGNLNIGDTTMGTQQNHSGNGDNVAGDKAEGDKVMGDKITNIIHNEKEKPPRLLTDPPFQTDFFIGRDNDLAAIESAYQQKKHLLMLVNGEGGMGKTTLAAHYWSLHEARYKHLAWVFADSGVGNALLRLAQPLGIAFRPQDDEKAQIARITEGVNQLDAPCLLVFDNANKADDLEKHFVTLKKLTNCHILLTSRVTKLANAPVHRVKQLDKEYAIALFKEYYQKHQDTEGELLDKLLDAVGYNTLVIELLAKNLTIFNDFDTAYSLQSLVTDLQDKGLFAIQNEVVDVVYQSEELRKETPERIIEAMYDLSALTDAEKRMLNNFAVLPAENIPFAILKDLIKPDDTNTFKQTLRALQQKGWIEYYDDTATFKISPVIQNVTKRENQTTLLDDCDTLIDTLIDKLQRDIIHEDNYKMATVFARYAEMVVAAFDTPIQRSPFGQYNAVVLCQRTGTYYETIGNLDRATIFYEKCSDLSKELCEISPNEADYKNGLAISYQYLGNTHTSLGNLEKALGFYEDYNRLEQELYAAYPTNVEFKNGLAISYSKLGETHTSLGNLEKALGFYEDYNRLEQELYAVYPTNVEFKNGLAISYSKLGETHTSLGNLEKALGFYEELNRLEQELYAAYPTNVEFKNGLAISYQYLGNTHTSLGNLEKALGFYEDYNRLEQELYAAYPTNVEFKNGLAISYSKLGNTHTSLGNLEKALGFYEDFNRLEQELYVAYPTNVGFKNSLAISYQNLGETHTSLGNLEKALGFYEELNRLEQELYAAYPTNVGFKNGLAISYQNLGNTHTSLGNLEKALGFYEDYNRLEQELYAAYPTNVAFKNNLAISYQYLGNTHTSLGNLEKALGFYEDYNRLEQELYAAYPTNVEFKNNLAISYSKLGNTHTSLGNLEKALGFYEELNRLEQELYAAYPTNVGFKNGLAISYAKLGVFNRDNLKNATKARAYFQEAAALWQALVRDAPQFVQFQRFLGIVQGILKDLD